ncbi:MAG: hypothetical protein HY520_05115 [Candidatus Aenigmarchaeota archaeon]|nr:hypothetical protein [Candidatus Aenigmarchaeota archaeon]
MREEKHRDIIAEVDSTIREALQSKNLLAHQRRLAAMLSLGAQQLLEVYLHRLHVIKPGTAVKHEWFGMGVENPSRKLAAMLTRPPGEVPGLAELLVLARVVEEGRNDLLYGSPLSDDEALRKKIDAYMHMRRQVGGP